MWFFRKHIDISLYKPTHLLAQRNVRPESLREELSYGI